MTEIDSKWLKVTPNDIQVSSEYKMCSQIFEPPPPTDQTEHARGLEFFMGSPHDSLLRFIEAIFDKSPLSRDMGVGWGTLGGAKNNQKFFSDFSIFFAIFG